MANRHMAVVAVSGLILIQQYIYPLYVGFICTHICILLAILAAKHLIWLTSYPVTIK